MVHFLSKMEPWSICNEAYNLAKWAQIWSNQPWLGIFGIIQNTWRIQGCCNYKSCSQLLLLSPRIFLEFSQLLAFFELFLFGSVFNSEIILPRGPTCRSPLSMPGLMHRRSASIWHREPRQRCHARAHTIKRRAVSFRPPVSEAACVRAPLYRGCPAALRPLSVRLPRRRLHRATGCRTHSFVPPLTSPPFSHIGHRRAARVWAPPKSAV
jgi:hypothetical protein